MDCNGYAYKISAENFAQSVFSCLFIYCTLSFDVWTLLYRTGLVRDFVFVAQSDTDISPVFSRNRLPLRPRRLPITPP